MNKYKLIIFDLDDTLTPFTKTELLPGVKEWFDANDAGKVMIAMATNQGGVGLRHWMEDGRFGNPEKYPTEQQVREHIEKVLQNLGTRFPVFMSFRYQSYKTGNWSPVPAGVKEENEWSIQWRKPAPGMLIEAMYLAGVPSHHTLMVGNDDEDRLAAEAAGCAFEWANVFFGRTPTNEGGYDTP